MKPAADRFWSKVVGNDLDECWLWTGATSGGYGVFYIDGRLVRAHRWSFEQLRADIPDGLHLDHLCRTRACVNPWHLDPVTQQENIRRGQGNGSKTHCPQGHPYVPENTYRAARGDRQCRLCKRNRTQPNPQENAA